MIPFSPPRIDQKIIDEVIETLKSGWITTGPKTKLFEKKLQEYTNSKRCLCLNSATAGLELILRWFGVKPGDEVILPAYTYCATANVVIHCGATPVFADICDDFNIDIKDVANKLTERTKVIIPVDICGLPCDYDELNSLINNNKNLFTPENEEQKKLGRVLLLSDSAHSIGAIYDNKKLGTQSDVSVFSFHAVKNLTTAEGGAISFNLPNTFDCEEIYNKLCIKSLHGQNKDALSKLKKGSWRYDIIEAGYKWNMTDIQAAIGLIELERYDSDMLVKRKQIFDKYTESFSKYSWAKLPITINNKKETSYHVYPLRINGINEDTRDSIISEIFEQEVSVNVHFIPLPLMSFYKSLGYNIKDYPVAYKNYSQEISLPVYYDLRDQDIEKVINAVVSAVESKKNNL
ncbi:MAG: capsular biosynthesis protein [Bacteroidetes bacterium GWE2_29_8]|nr:MAG: capsular biosynthesis protein [Bacteroidetes bacterium GWE2_29_8]OFY22157.1 MAG: capsular biosynthesis protein [Bacteroidetes bacterium GWF2_29_10]